MANKYYAHSGTEENGDSWQSLEDHLNAVAATAEQFADKFDMGPYGRLLGLLHDAGKASSEFQQRLQGKASGVDHSTAGTKMAVRDYGDAGRLLAYLIAGHHGGIPSGIAQPDHAKPTANAAIGTPLEERLKRNIPDYSGFNELAATGQLTLPRPDELPSFFPLKHALPPRMLKEKQTLLPGYLAYYAYFLGRMLYSSLVDADYLDTEAAMTPDSQLQRNSTAYATIEELQTMLSAHMESLMTGAPSTAVNTLRRRIYDECLTASQLEPGLFSLTVPTGGGKTLSSVAFALSHAKKYGLERVILAIPFMSITSQTAQILKSIFGSNNVLEHHSSYDYSDLDEGNKIQQRLAVQNWDAPIVVTTNVQLFESLYSNKPSKSRKVHNLAKSVIILDEAQTLPDHLLIASLAALEELTLRYKSTAVLCTATQPCLDEHWPFGSHPREIITNQNGFKETFGSRVTYKMLGDIDYEELITKLCNHDQALCIVGTKGAASRIYEDVVAQAAEEGKVEDVDKAHQSGYFHLSAYMVPAHRQHLINVIKERLRDGLPCIVISTQLIEAGVDVDFPAVYRELAGLESIVQAGGRCNREGKASRPGTVYVFECFAEGERMKTGAWLEKLKGIARDCIHSNDSRIDESLIPQYFKRRYQDTDLDSEKVYQKIADPREILEPERLRSMEFEYAAMHYQIIDDDTVSVFVPWGEEGNAILRALLEDNTSQELTSHIQSYSISVPIWAYKGYCQSGAISTHGIYPVLEYNQSKSFYREDVGLVDIGREEMGFLAM